MIKHIHLIGIGGSGLSAIARLLKERGFEVSGSDRVLSPVARQLMGMGVQVFIGHTAGNIEGADIVVRSSAIPDENPEVRAAQEAGIPVMKRSEFLGALMTNMNGIAVAGTHGKTTTTAMIAWLLVQLGQDPSYIIGGVSKNLSSNAHSGRGREFVIEADEYDRMFLGLRPNMAIITSVEHDHPDCFPTPLDYQQAFAAFVQRLKPGGMLLVNADDMTAVGMVNYRPAHTYARTYGLNPAANYTARNLQLNETGSFSFDLVFQPEDGGRMMLGSVDLTVPGEHNVVNALAALAIVHELGLSMLAATQAIASYAGTGRRFDLLGEAQGIQVLDDYAHHPTEIRATLAAARSRYPGNRIWAVWQPHTYSRTRSLQNEFAEALRAADRVVITQVYAAREKDESYSAEEVLKEMNHPGATYIPDLQAVTQYLLNELQPGDVVLVLSAGDADQVSAAVLDNLRAKERQHA